MIVSPISPAVRPAEPPARPARPRIRGGAPGPRVDVAALLRRALVRNELLLTIGAAPRPTRGRGL